MAPALLSWGPSAKAHQGGPGRPCQNLAHHQDRFHLQQAAEGGQQALIIQTRALTHAIAMSGSNIMNVQSRKRLSHRAVAAAGDKCDAPRIVPNLARFGA